MMKATHSGSTPREKERQDKDTLVPEASSAALPVTHSHGDLCLNCLVDISEDLNSSLDLDEILERVSVRLRPFLDYDSFAVLLLDPLGTELRFRFGVGFPGDVLRQWRFGVGQGLVGSAAQTKQIVRVGNVQSDPRYINAGPQIQSEMALPLVVKQRLIGVLDLGKNQRDYFRPGHERLLRPLAGTLANAIENARLYENVREQARSLSLLQQASRDLSSILQRDKLLEKVALLVRRMADFQLFSVMLLDEKTQTLKTAFSMRFDGHAGPVVDIPLGTGICGTAAALQRAIRVPNVHVDPRYVACRGNLEMGSELAVPLIHKERLLGVLDLESAGYNAFTEEHEQMVSTLAANVAIALENVRLYEKVKQDEQRLEHDLATAREIQRGLLPDQTPEVDGLDLAFAYQPARQLGGDFYDFLNYANGKLAIVIGDVAGKATAAALYGSLAVGIVRSKVIEHGCCPSEMLERLNDPLREPRIDNRFVAMTYAVYDPVERTLALASAAFPRPWLIREGEVREIPSEGLPLGILPDARYEQHTIRLTSGDTIVFASDGFHETMNAQGEEYGLDRMAELFRNNSHRPVQHLVNRLVEDVQQHGAAAEELADDRTMIALKVI